MDMYQEITNNIVDALEGVSANKWKCPWGSTMPHNGSTKKEYNGINVLLLWVTSMVKEYTSPDWYTYKQATALGGQVRKGEKGTRICFFRPVEIHKDAEGNRVPKAEAVDSTKFPMLRGYTVFNRAQIDGLPEVESQPTGRHTEADAFLARIPAKVNYGTTGAYYRPSTDEIGMPDPDIFHTTAGLYATMFHEFGHWTGHTTRLSRDLTGRFGSESYAIEELVAELTSAFLCAEFGITGELQHPEYIKSWVSRLKEDKYAIFTAAREAKAAANFLKGASGTEEEVEEEDAA